MTSIEASGVANREGRGSRSGTWDLREDGLVVIERSLGSTGPRRLLIGRPAFCATPQCECRDVMLTAVGVEIPADGDREGLTTDQLRSLLKDAEWMHARIGIDAGLVEPDDYEGRAPLTDEWIECLESAVDGELLDRFHEELWRAKGFRFREPHEVSWPARPRDELVGWYEAHPEARPDTYIDDDDAFAAEELYCVNPDCDCNEAVVAFSVLRARVASPIGHLRVHLSSGKVLDQRGPSQRLERLWSAYCARHRGACGRIARRKRIMLELAESGAAARSKPVRAGVRVGRNDPCPCGSGKKHKRCCGALQTA
jgi:hypothetical protein